MPPSFWVASTKPEAALARGQGWQPWQERGWTLAPRDRGPEAGMYCWMRHLVPGDPNGAGLGQGLDHELVDVDVERPGEREEDALGDVLGPKRVDAFVRPLRLLLVAAEANTGEVRLDEPGIDGRQPDRAPEQVLAQRIGEAAHRELRGDIDGGVLVGLAPGDRAEVDDVPAVADVWQTEARHPDQAVDVRFEHRLFVLFGRLPKRIASETEACVVDEDVQATTCVGTSYGLDKPLAARLVGDVQLEPDLRLQLVDAARTAGDAGALPCERACSRGADAARGACDDRSLSFEARHDRRRLARGHQQGEHADDLALLARAGAASSSAPQAPQNVKARRVPLA